MRTIAKLLVSAIESEDSIEIDRVVDGQGKFPERLAVCLVALFTGGNLRSALRCDSNRQDEREQVARLNLVTQIDRQLTH